MFFTLKFAVLFVSLLLFSCGEKGFNMKSVGLGEDDSKKISTGKEGSTIKYGEGEEKGKKKLDNKDGQKGEGASLPSFKVKDMLAARELSDNGGNVLFAENFRESKANSFDSSGASVIATYGVVNFRIYGSKSTLDYVGLMSDSSQPDAYKQTKSWFSKRLKNYVHLPAKFINFIPDSGDIGESAVRGTVKSFKRIEAGLNDSKVIVTIGIKGLGNLNEGTLICQASEADQEPDFSACEERYAKDSVHNVRFLNISAPKNDTENEEFEIKTSS